MGFPEEMWVGLRAEKGGETNQGRKGKGIPDSRRPEGLGSRRAGRAAWAAAEVGPPQAQLPRGLCSKGGGKGLQCLDRGLPPASALGGHRTPLAVGKRGRAEQTAVRIGSRSQASGLRPRARRTW